MKNIRHRLKGDTKDNRLEISDHQNNVPKSKLLTGSVVEKFPVLLDYGKTIVFIADKSRERDKITVSHAKVILL